MYNYTSAIVLFLVNALNRFTSDPGREPPYSRNTGRSLLMVGRLPRGAPLRYGRRFPFPARPGRYARSNTASPQLRFGLDGC